MIVSFPIAQIERRGEMRMNTIQYSFQRYEKKFLLTPGQYKALIPELLRHMSTDQYGLHTICNIYYDTDNFDLIRASLDKPMYKEKFRLRSYGVPDDDAVVFAEIKKKFDGVVYKRRVAATAWQMDGFLKGERLEHEAEQIQREIRWFLHKYELSPKVFIGYERVAWAGLEDSELRITFDQNIRWRVQDLDLRRGTQGSPVLDQELILMEVKLPMTSPLWLADALNGLRIYSTSFSKYGTCYQRHLARKFTAERNLVYAQQHSHKTAHPA